MNMEIPEPESVKWAGNHIPKPLGDWRWLNCSACKNRGGRMKKMRGKRYKGRNSHRKMPEFGVTYFECNTGREAMNLQEGEIEENFVFRYIGDPNREYVKPPKKPRCYSYPPRRQKVRM